MPDTSDQVNNPVNVVGPQQPAPAPIASASSQQDAGAATPAPDVNTPAPATVGGPANAATPPAPYGNAPGTVVPKQTFREGMAAQGPPAYHTDANGNVISNTPVRAPSVKGVLGQILMGALEGAARGAAAQTPEGARGKGAAFSAGAAAAQKGRLEADDRARAIAQRNFENRQSQTAEKVKANLMVAQTHDLIQKSQLDLETHAAELHSRGITDEEHQLNVNNGLDQRREVHANLIQALISHGVQPYATLSQTPNADGKTMDEQAMAHVKPLVGGKAIPVQNGKVGDKNGAALFSDKDLDLPVSGNPNDPASWIQVPTYDGTKDNSGKFVSHDTVIKPDGKTTYGDVARQFMAADAQLQHYMGLDAQTMSKKYQQAEIKEKEGAAFKDTEEGKLAQAQAENLAKINSAPPANFKPNPNSFSMSAPDLQKDLQQQGVNTPGDFAALYAAAHYKADPNTFPARITAKTGQTPKSSAISYIRNYINPNYDEANYSAVKKMETEFANPDQGHAGGNLIAFNTATAHLGQLYDAAKALQTGDVQVLNKMAQYYGVQTGQSPVLTFNAIRGALAGEIGKTFKGSAADIPEREGIEKSINAANSPQQAQDVAKTYAHLMLSKVGSTVAHYAAYTGELPPEAIQPAASAVFERMGIDPNSVLPTNAKVSVGGTGNANPQQPPAQTPEPFITGGKSFQPDANGQFKADGWIWQVAVVNGQRTAKALKPAPAQ